MQLDPRERRAVVERFMVALNGVLVAVTNRPQSPGIKFGQEHGIPTVVLPRDQFPTRAAQQAAMLAGYSSVDQMRRNINCTPSASRRH